MPQDTNAALVIVDTTSGDTLLVERDGHLTLPGGRVRHGETPLDTVLRVVEAQTGLRAGALSIGLPAEYALPRHVTIDAAATTVIYAAVRGGKGAVVAEPGEGVARVTWFNGADDTDTAAGVAGVLSTVREATGR